MKLNFRLRSSGFTLAEMMAAIALAAMMIVTVFGVMGTAQINLNQAGEKSTQARIAQEIVSEILLNDWSSILEYQGADRYFDPEGNPVEVSEGGETEPDMWAFRASIEINEGQAQVPGANDRQAFPVMSRRVIVRITNGYYPKYDFETGTRHRNFPTWVAKTDKM